MSTEPTPVLDFYSHTSHVARSVASSNEFFTTDDIWEALRDTQLPEVDHRVMGSVMRRLSLDGVAVRTMYTRVSRRSCCHYRPVSVWQSRIYSSTSHG